MKEKNILLFGGKSVESDISVITALQVMQNMPQNLNFLPVYIDKNGIWWIAENLGDAKIYQDFEKLSKKIRQVSCCVGTNVMLVKKSKKFVPFCKIDCVINCCHGGAGEGGAVQGLLECCEISQTSSLQTSSALCMDKCFFKQILCANKIETPKFVILKSRNDIEKTKKLKFPVVVKPSGLGSSIGISFCHSFDEVVEAVELAFSFDQKVIVEEAVQNLREFNCAIFEFQGKTFLSSVSEVKNKAEIYSFENKYLATDVKNEEAGKTLSKRIKKLTQQLYELFDCAGVVRVDFLFDEKQDKLYVNEINTIPGSMAFYLFKDISFSEILLSIVKQAKISQNSKQKLVKAFESDAIKIFDECNKKIKK